MSWRCKHCDREITGRNTEHCVADLPDGRICCQSFAGTYGGDSHRIGAFDAPPGSPDARRCRTPAEMTVGGMWQDDRGTWHGEWNKAGKQKRMDAKALAARQD